MEGRYHCLMETANCTRNFHSLRSLEAHEREVHNTNSLRECMEPDCHVKRARLADHLLSVHSIET